jgi:excinuclease ABC subunit C
MPQQKSADMASIEDHGPEGGGFALIRRELATLPNSPGVYRMLDAGGRALYVGKARDLRKRVAAYTQPNRLEARHFNMVRRTAALEVITTHTEVEALLLESNLIKKLKPHYNVLLRDDKSFAYIRITGGHAFPQITKHRGPRTEPGEYFGPFASAGAVNRTLATFARAFPLRTCSDSEFARRTRPCLQYQIKRCSAPCVAKIAAADYGALVAEARDFLSGRSRDLNQKLAQKMQAASAALDYEHAARLRDRISALAHVTAHQDINVQSLGDSDVIAASASADQVCIQVFFFRGGQNFGNRAYFPAHTRQVPLPDVLAAFIGQFYESRPAPRQILVSERIPQQALLAEALAVGAGHRVAIAKPARGPKLGVVAHALANAREALARRYAESATQKKLLDALAERFGCKTSLRRIEVYDNSHLQGSEPLGAMIVAGPDGFIKAAYRKFNIRGENQPAGRGGSPSGGDDYAMLREVLERRFGRLMAADPGQAGAEWPDLLLIDGGRGHLNVALKALAELRQGKDGQRKPEFPEIAVAAISKGPDRNAGREQFHLAQRTSFALEPRDPVLYFLQRLRDEAHRFAISGHRNRRAKGAFRSALDEIAGIGAARKKALLLHFGSSRGVAEAGLADLEAVSGISANSAERIYNHFHERR